MGRHERNKSKATEGSQTGETGVCSQASDKRDTDGDKSDSGSASRQRFCSVGSYSRSTEGWRPKRNVTSTLPLQPRTGVVPSSGHRNKDAAGWKGRAHSKANTMKLVETYQQQQQQQRDRVSVSFGRKQWAAHAGRKWFRGQASRDKAAAAQGEIR